MNNNLKKKIDSLYQEYQNTLEVEENIKKKDLVSEKQKQLFSHIISKTKLSQNEKQQLEKKVSKLTKKQFARLICIYNYRKSSFLNRLKKFRVKIKETIIFDNPEFQIGYQINNKAINNTLFYIKFYNFLILDYDGVSLDFVKENLSSLNNIFKFAIYETDNGFHVFLMSKLFNYNNQSNMMLMKELKCDEKYIFFTYRNAFKLRLSPKKKYRKIANQQFIEMYGDGLICPECLNYLKIIDVVSDLFKLN